MNTIRSVGYGWAWLIVAGGGAYYYAKKSVNKDREERAMMDQRRRAAQQKLRDMEYFEQSQASSKKAGTKSANSSGPSDSKPSIARGEASDPAPVTHEREPPPRGKYEAAEPYRSRKGDRFS